MANVQDFRTRIRSVKSTQQITRAMKLVAASKLRRAQESVVMARPYARKMLEVLSSLAARANPETHPLLAQRPEERAIVVVITADKGLCGSFNTNILNAARHFLDDLKAEDVQVDVVGRKGRDWFKRRTYRTRRVLVDLFRNLSLRDAKQIVGELIEGFSRAEVDAVYLVYNEFKSAIQQQVVVRTLLPIPRSSLSGSDASRSEGSGSEAARVAAVIPPEDYIYEPDAPELFSSLLPKHVEVQVYHALLESSAAEHGARMSAMENATRNAGEMIETLTLQMNKIRQSAITNEILEVVSGAEALK
ncbi:MAG: ATP synthase F1 subunit gamma [Thermoanaerobaculia bacterium]|jgi:F-type H+-transporting ATPase subunit gamma